MKNKKPIIILSLFFLLVVLAEFFAPKPIDWTLTLMRQHKIPLGTYVVYNLLGEVFPTKIISDNTLSLPQFEAKYKPKEENIIIIEQRLNLDKLSANVLLKWAEDGNHILIAAEEISPSLADTLGIKYDYHLPFVEKKETKEIYLNFTNPKLKTDSSYKYDKIFGYSYIASFDTANSTVLGRDSAKSVTFLKIQKGNGFFLINTQPMAFCNYNMLKYNNYEYVTKVLSYLPITNVIWDEYHKPGRIEDTSILRFIMSKSELKTAWYLLLISICVYIIFMSKRQQRIIPLRKQPANTTMEFIETIGRLYLNTANHKDLANKKILYFNEFVRSKYYIKQISFTDEAYKNLSEKSGVSSKIIKKIYETWREISKASNISENTLIRFNILIEEFYQKCK